MMRRNLGSLALAWTLLAAPAAAFDLLECDRDDVFGNSGATIGWGGAGGNVMGNWEIDTSGAPGSGISSEAVTFGISEAILEWTAVSGAAYAGPTTSPASFTAADVLDTLDFDAPARARHIAMMVHDDLIIDGLEGWGALQTSFATATILGVCYTRIDDETRLVYDADIFLNDDFSHGGPGIFQGAEGTARVFPSGPRSFEVQSIMAHEFGHAQGSAHTTRDSVMFQFIPNLTQNRLTEDDGNILRWLYPTAPNPVPPDRNNPGFITCDRLIATNEIVIENSSGGGCDLAGPRRDSWPLALGVFLLVLGADARARRGRSRG